jgi:nucleotide-binding universal stress UspA family protein
LAVGENRSCSYGAPFFPIDPQTVKHCAQEAAQCSLRHALDELPEDLPLEHRTLVGNPAELIAKESEDHDLLLVGSRGYGPVRRTLLGGVAARLARTARCPLLVLPRGAGTDPLHLAEITHRQPATVG